MRPSGALACEEVSNYAHRCNFGVQGGTMRLYGTLACEEGSDEPPLCFQAREGGAVVMEPWRPRKGGMMHLKLLVYCSESKLLRRLVLSFHDEHLWISVVC